MADAQIPLKKTTPARFVALSAQAQSVFLLADLAALGQMGGGSDPENSSGDSENSECDGESPTSGESSDASESDSFSNGGGSARGDGSSSGGDDSSSDDGSDGESAQEQRSQDSSQGSEVGEESEAGEVEAEHKKRCALGVQRCPHCRWIRHRSVWKKCLNFEIQGQRSCWVEEVVDVGKSWGLGCKLRRWAGEPTKCARGEVRGGQGDRAAPAHASRQSHSRLSKPRTRQIPAEDAARGGTR